MTNKLCGSCKNSTTCYVKDNLKNIHVCEWYKNEKDNVNQPSHYTKGGIETIDYIKAKQSKEKFAEFLQGNVIKYISRYEDKGGVEDLRKAENNLRRLIELEEKREVEKC